MRGAIHRFRPAGDSHGVAEGDDDLDRVVRDPERPERPRADRGDERAQRQEEFAHVEERRRDARISHPPRQPSVLHPVERRAQVEPRDEHDGEAEHHHDMLAVSVGRNLVSSALVVVARGGTEGGDRAVPRPRGRGIETGSARGERRLVTIRLVDCGRVHGAGAPHRKAAPESCRLEYSTLMMPDEIGVSS